MQHFQTPLHLRINICSASGRVELKKHARFKYNLDGHFNTNSFPLCSPTRALLFYFAYYSVTTAQEVLLVKQSGGQAPVKGEILTPRRD